MDLKNSGRGLDKCQQRVILFSIMILDKSHAMKWRHLLKGKEESDGLRMFQKWNHSSHAF